MTDLPNPFDPEPTTSTGGCQESPAETSTVTVAAGPAGDFDPDRTYKESLQVADRFVLDVPAFMEALEPMPAFLSNPSAEYQVGQIMPELRILAGR